MLERKKQQNTHTTYQQRQDKTCQKGLEPKTKDKQTNKHINVKCCWTADVAAVVDGYDKLLLLLLLGELGRSGTSGIPGLESSASSYYILEALAGSAH